MGGSTPTPYPGQQRSPRRSGGSSCSTQTYTGRYESWSGPDGPYGPYPATVTHPQPHCGERCRLLAPLTWPAPRPSTRQLHRLLASLADLLDAVAAAHRLTTELAAGTAPPEQGWGPALTTIDLAAVDTTDTVALTRQLTDHDLDEAADLLRRGLDHRLQALQLLRRAIRAEQFAALDHRHVEGLLAAVIYSLDQAGRSLAAADQTVTTAALEMRS